MAHDITFVNRRVAVGGGIFCEENMQAMKRKGITHIIDAQAEWDDTPIAEKLGIKTLWVPATDDYREPPPQLFEAVYKFVKKELKPNQNTKVMCHCAAGVHRGPMFGLLAMLLLEDNLSTKRAVKLICERRLIADFPLVYRDAVEKFVEKKRKGK